MLRSIAELEQAVAALKPATLSPQQVTPLVRGLGSPELLAELAREDRPEGWPAGWCEPLADLLDRVRGDSDQLAPLLEAIDELPPLLQTTLRMELLRLGWFEEDQISDALLEAMIAHTLRQLERPESPRFLRDALETLALARPEAVWRANLVQAAAQRQGPGYARWPELERHVLPYASSAQRVELACRHRPKPGPEADHDQDRFTTARPRPLPSLKR